MKFPVYSIRDNKANTFDSPIVGTNDFVIQRSLAEELVNNRNRIISFSPRDFDLYKIGEFDIEKGLLIPKVPVELIASCEEVISNYAYKKE